MPWWWFGGRTVVQNLIRDYEDLETRIQRAINTMTTERDNFRDERVSIHNRLTTYEEAEGNIVELFYNNVEENRSRFTTINTNLIIIVNSLTNKRNEVTRKLGQLERYRQREIDEDHEFTLDEINLW